MGQKGRACHAWWLRGQRPPGLAGKRFSFACVFAAVEPSTGRSACLVPEVSTAAMQVLLDSFPATLAAGAHAALVVDGAGWHVSLDLRVPDNVTLVPRRPVRPSSTRWSGSGSTCASGS